MWHATPRDKPNFLLSIELVLQDEKGEKIYATIPRSVVHRFRGEKNTIKEMRLYLMNTFVAEPNNMHYKTTAHKFKLEFTPKTIVVETTDPAFDVIGQVVCHAEKQTHQLRNGTTSQFLNVVIEDNERKTITATFWGKFVDKIMPHLHNLIDEPVIVVMQLIRVHKFQELTTGTVQFKTIKELLDSVQVGHLWILAKIVNLKLKNNWSYLRCIKCHKSVEKVAKNILHCKKCGRDYQTATHSYRVQIKVLDDTGIVSLLLWDNEAITLIEKFASELKDCPLEIFDSPYECSYPIELDVLLDRIIMFRLYVKQENIESRDRVYGVAKINDDEELIN
ncbi:hypothetical protein P3L10_009259 [Capsicum annuum]